MYVVVVVVVVVCVCVCVCVCVFRNVTRTTVKRLQSDQGLQYAILQNL